MASWGRELNTIILNNASLSSSTLFHPWFLDKQTLYFSQLFFFPSFFSFLRPGFNHQMALGKRAALGHALWFPPFQWGWLHTKGAPHAAGMPRWCAHSCGRLGKGQPMLWDTMHSDLSARGRGRSGLSLISIQVGLGTLHIKLQIASLRCCISTTSSSRVGFEVKLPFPLSSRYRKVGILISVWLMAYSL